MIISGGFNIYPRDVDEVLFTHPKVLEACVIGVPTSTPRAHQGVRGAQVRRNGHARGNDRFLQTESGEVQGAQVRGIRGRLAKSAVGKILRKELRRIDQAKAKGNEK